MQFRVSFAALFCLGLFVVNQNTRAASIDITVTPAKGKKSMTTAPIPANDEEWKSALTPAQFCIMRQKGTEAPFKNAYWDHHEKGTYFCAGCRTALFKSAAKFDSGTGWPSFFQPASAEAIQEKVDTDHGMVRTEVLCKTCGSHLGHVFDDGPAPSGRRYCINSASLKFIKE